MHDDKGKHFVTGNEIEVVLPTVIRRVRSGVRLDGQVWCFQPAVQNGKLISLREPRSDRTLAFIVGEACRAAFTGAVVVVVAF